MVLIGGQTQALVVANDRTSVIKKGTTKHCFVQFPKPGKIKDIMREWERGEQKRKTEKCRKCDHACGRKDFTVDNAKKDTCIGSIHFIGSHGPLIFAVRNKVLSGHRRYLTSVNEIIVFILFCIAAKHSEKQVEARRQACLGPPVMMNDQRGIFGCILYPYCLVK